LILAPEVVTKWNHFIFGLRGGLKFMKHFKKIKNLVTSLKFLEPLELLELTVQKSFRLPLYSLSLGILILFTSSVSFSEKSSKEEESSLPPSESRIEFDHLKPEMEAEKNRKEITNARLAADAGSLSKFSTRFFLTYSGGSAEDPFGKRRPNYRRIPGSPILDTMISGSVGLAYRLDSHSQARFSTGLSVRTPLHNSFNEILSNKTSHSAQTTKIFNVSNPSLSYNRTFRNHNLMHSFNVGMSLSTDEQDVKIVRSLGSVSTDLTTILDLEGSRFQLGVTAGLGQFFYLDNGMFDTVGRARGLRRFGLYPFTEYKFNDTYAFRTLIGMEAATFRHNPGSLFHLDNYISSGIGISPTRDIWIYPNIQFNVKDRNSIRSDLTNVGVTTIFNI
jgi:hypothetical protein